jgi:hypothetical protein
MSTAARAAAPKSRNGRQTPKVTLPPITVAKFEETGRLLERVIAENQSMFIEKGQAYKDAHRQGSSRPLSPHEAAVVAASIASEAGQIQTAAEVQQSSLRVVDEPDSREILLAAGIGAAPAFMAAVRQVVALVEMPNVDFEEACEHDTLDQALEHRAAALRSLEIGEARTRASSAFNHYARSAGFEPGEAWRLPGRAVWQALQGAMSDLTDAAQSLQLTDSAASTPGLDEQSSTS